MKYAMRLYDLTLGGSFAKHIADVEESEHERFRLIAERCNDAFGAYGEWQMIVQEVSENETEKT